MSNFVTNTTAEQFEKDVFEQSKQTPVVVDFWAEWCAPCRMLGPILEELAEEFQGRFRLVKAETEKVPNEAARFNVQGIPAVFGVCDGEIVDYFTGALPKNQIQQWLERLMGNWEFVEAKRAEESNPSFAESTYRQLRQKYPQVPEPAIGLARVLLKMQRTDESRAILAELERRGFLEPEAQKVLAAIELSHGKGADVESLRRQCAEKPNDFSLRLKLGETLAANGEYENALEILLALVQQDRKGTGERAKTLMVDIFRVLPDDSELVRTFRRKLTSALY